MNWIRHRKTHVEMLIQHQDRSDVIVKLDAEDAARVARCRAWRFDPNLGVIRGGSSRARLTMYILGLRGVRCVHRNGSLTDCRRKNLAPMCGAAIIRTGENYVVVCHTGTRCQPCLNFAIRKYRSEFGYRGGALQMARKAAERFKSMTPAEVIAWWKRKPSRSKRYVCDEKVSVGFIELAQMSHAYQPNRY